MKPNPPQYANQPIILSHATVTANDGSGRQMYWCGPYPVIEESNPPNYPDIPRVACPRCYGTR